MHVVVDRERCEGHGMCEDAAPQVFTLDDDGQAVVLADPVPPELQAATDRAVGLCPVAALLVRPSPADARGAS